MKLFRAIFIFCCGVFLLISINAHACTLEASMATASFDIPEVIIPPGPIPPGTMLYISTATASDGGETRTAPCPLYSKYLKGQSVGGAKFQGVSDYYSTNIPGVAFTICQFNLCNVNAENLGSPPFVGEYNSPSDGGKWGLRQHSFMLVATGQPISSGALETGVYGEIGVTGQGKLIEFILNSGTIKAADCELVNNNPIDIDFGTIPSTTFTGVGHVSEIRTFDVGLTCDANANISVTLEGDASAGTDGSVISLTDTGQAATGIGVQILYDNIPLTIGQDLTLKMVTKDTTEFFQFSARYYQSADVVTTGDANATATLVITHQ